MHGEIQTPASCRIISFNLSLSLAKKQKFLFNGMQHNEMKRIQLFCLVIVTLLVVSMTTHAQSAADILAYVDKYKQIALEQERIYGIPAPITLAQGILESGAGKSGLTRNSNNHFGIKALGGWSGGVYKAWDDEPQKSSFRVYATASESFHDHSKVLKAPRYRSLFTKSIYDYRGWAIGLQKCGYATAKNYAAALIGFIDTYRLYAINGGVKLRPGKTVIVTQTVATAPPTFDASCQMDDEEQSEEEQTVKEAVTRYVVDINDVSCTILYPGTTLSSISMQYDIPKDLLLEYNEVVVEEELHEGDIIFLDKKKKKYTGAKDFYHVREGDTLYSISQQFGIKVASLAKMNHRDISEKLYEGDKLCLK
jgi:LysM repeat protein